MFVGRWLWQIRFNRLWTTQRKTCLLSFMHHGVAIVKNWSPNIQSLENRWALHDISMASISFWILLILFSMVLYDSAIQWSQYSNRQDGCNCQRCPSGLWRTRACIHILSSLTIKSFIFILVSIVNVLLFFHRFPTIYFAAAGRKDEPKRYEVVFISTMTMFLMVYYGYHVHIFVIMNMRFFVFWLSPERMYFVSGSPWSEGFHQLPEAWGVQTSCPKRSQGRAVNIKGKLLFMKSGEFCRILLLFSHTYQIKLISSNQLNKTNCILYKVLIYIVHMW